MVALLFAALPVWGSRYLPLFDLPNHLAAISVWRNLGDPTYGLGELYRLNLQPVPYWGYFATVLALSRVVGVEIANKLFVTAYVVAMVWGVARLAKKTGRDPRLSLLVFPLLFTYSFKWGWLSFLGGTAVLLFAIEALLDCLGEPRWSRLLALGALALLTYAMHILPWFVLGVIAITFLVLSLRRWRAVLLTGAALIPSLLVAVYNFVHAAPASSGPNSVVRAGTKFVGNWEALDRSLRFLPFRFTTMTDSRVEMICASLFGGIVAIALLSGILRRQSRSAANEPPTRLSRWAPELIALILTVLYFSLPIHIKQPIRWWGINFRLVPLIGMFIVLLVRGEFAGWRRALLAGSVGIFAITAVWLSLEFREFNRRAAGFDALLAHVPMGASVLYLCFERSDERFFYSAESFSEMGGYIQVRRGGYYPYQFETGFPMLPKAPQRFPAPAWSTLVHDFDPRAHASRFPFVLTYAEPSTGAAFRNKGALPPPLVAESGRWRLYASSNR